MIRRSISVRLLLNDCDYLKKKTHEGRCDRNRITDFVVLFAMTQYTGSSGHRTGLSRFSRATRSGTRRGAPSIYSRSAVFQDHHSTVSHRATNMKFVSTQRTPLMVDRRFSRRRRRDNRSSAYRSDVQFFPHCRQQPSSSWPSRP